MSEVVSALGEPGRHRAMDVVAASRPGASLPRGLVVLEVRLEHPLRVVGEHGVSEAIARETSTQCIPGPGDLERRKEELAEHLLAPRDLELRSRERVRAREHHVHRQPAAALGDEPLLGARP